ncbi:MAG: hypothetical protein KJ787_03865 [Gammaproteobacteria bacterium]|nr:hypothetical protein [Gammaproteobacteria bacterium]MBU1645450.1 hypothetical protein [Gammaproteobacteria bacterium]MBU1971073.1 hypothetical protein [Gammaproteobacteria bacterium]
MTPFKTTYGALTPLKMLPGVAGFAAVLMAAPLHAQTPPDAGQLLREQPKAPSVVPATPAPIAPAAPAAEPDAGPRVLVKGFRIQGALLISEAELVAQLQDVVGKELSFRQLQGTASHLIAYYAQKGYLARVVLPPQDVKDGIVVLQVVEGKRGSLRIDRQGERLDSARVERLIDGRLASGDTMDIARLGEALNILNEQPGIEAKAALAPGKGEAEIDLVVTAADKPLTNYSLGINNQGSVGTGKEQANGSISINNPTGSFDAASLMLNASQGATFGRADYSRAVGDGGLRLGVNASRLDYRLVQSTFAALRGQGSASTVGLTASYPLARREDFNLSFTAAADGKQLIDRTVAGETGNRNVTVASLGLDGYRVDGPDSLLSGGITRFGTSLVVGNSDQRNRAALTADRAGRQVQGGFSKLGYSLGRLQSLTETWSIDAGLRGQFAGKNLDSTERFSLGGPGGVRGYPVGEASGDEGWLFNASLNYRMNDSVGLSTFVDAGGITINRRTWAGWNAGTPGLSNSYELAGAGFGFDWRPSKSILINATLAGPLGSNPGRDARGRDSDNDTGTRSWLSLTAQF